VSSNDFEHSAKPSRKVLRKTLARPQNRKGGGEKERAAKPAFSFNSQLINMAPSLPPRLAWLAWLLAALAAAAAVVGAAAQQEAAAGEQEEAEEGNTRYWVYVHAILMSLAWVGLLPREVNARAQQHSGWCTPVLCICAAGCSMLRCTVLPAACCC
jgi:hypothetical protein